MTWRTRSKSHTIKLSSTARSRATRTTKSTSPYISPTKSSPVPSLSNRPRTTNISTVRQGYARRIARTSIRMFICSYLSKSSPKRIQACFRNITSFTTRSSGSPKPHCPPQKSFKRSKTSIESMTLSQLATPMSLSSRFQIS